MSPFNDLSRLFTIFDIDVYMMEIVSTVTLWLYSIDFFMATRIVVTLVFLSVCSLKNDSTFLDDVCLSLKQCCYHLSYN